MGKGKFEEYLQGACGLLRKELQEELAAVWLSGSMVLGDFEAKRSDIDLICICRRTLSRGQMLRLSQAMSQQALPCPAAGLDLALLKQSAVQNPVCPLPYELGLASGKEWEMKMSLGGQETELLIDLEICRRYGRSLFGTPPSQMIGPIPEKWIADALQIIIEWHSRHIHHPFHDPLGHNAVLNACRAMQWSADRQFASKAQAGRWALMQAPSCSVIQKALDIRSGNRNKPLNKPEVLIFLRSFLSP